MKFTLSVLKRVPNAPGAVREIGAYDGLEGAIAAAKCVVDEALKRHYVAGMSAAQLVEAYRNAAETPYLARDDDQTMNANSFNHFLYAKARSEEICGGA